MTDTDGSIADVVDAQIEQQGTSVIRVDDGHVFTFTEATLRVLLEQSKAAGKVLVFVKHGVQA